MATDDLRVIQTPAAASKGGNKLVSRCVGKLLCKNEYESERFRNENRHLSFR